MWSCGFRSVAFTFHSQTLFCWFCLENSCSVLPPDDDLSGQNAWETETALLTLKTVKSCRKSCDWISRVVVVGMHAVSPLHDHTHTHTRLGCSIPLLKMQSSLSVARVGSHLLLSILHAWAKHVPVWGGNTFHMRPSMAFVSWCHTLVMHSGRDWTYTNKFLKKVRFSVLPHFAGLQRNNVHVHNNLRRTLLWTLISWPRHRCLCPSCSKSFYFCLSKNETLLIPSDWATINISWLKRRDENNVTMSKGLLVVAARLQLLRFVSFLPFSLCYY